MKENQFLTLLRGINVGGNNIIKMTDLKLCFENMSLNKVLTYIQSGNVIFESKTKEISKLTIKIEQALSKKFNYNSRIVVISYQQLKNIVNQAPYNFGLDTEKYRYDVFFIKEPLTPSLLMKKVKPLEGVDNVYEGEFVLYTSRLINKASQSHISRIIALPEYQNITIRNWNTTTRLLSLMDNREAR